VKNLNFTKMLDKYNYARGKRRRSFGEEEMRVEKN
jgi:hypothetical protein